MEGCLFCKIFKGEIPSDKVFESDKVIGFKDITPLAKTHLLFIHKNHHQDLNQSVQEDPQGMLEVLEGITRYSRESGLKESGYRVVTNIGKTAGQSVFHTHFHVLSSAKLGVFGD